MASLDSVVFERTACFGTCPAYTLVLTSAGHVRFTSLNKQERGRIESDSIAPSLIADLLPAAARAGVFELPSVIAMSREFCPSAPTDAPTAIVNLFGSGRAVQIVDYQACLARGSLAIEPKLHDLRTFERLIDSLADSKRWTRPNCIRPKLEPSCK